MKTQHVVMEVMQQPRDESVSVAQRVHAGWHQLRRWKTLHDQRRQLASLSDATLKDIGLSRLDAEQEASRPFWDDPQTRA